MTAPPSDLMEPRRIRGKWAEAVSRVLFLSREAFPAEYPPNLDDLRGFSEGDMCISELGGRSWDEVFLCGDTYGLSKCLHFLSEEALAYYLPLFLLMLVPAVRVEPVGSDDIQFLYDAIASHDRFSIGFSLAMRYPEISNALTPAQLSAAKECIAIALGAESLCYGLTDFRVLLTEYAPLISAWFRE